MSDYSVTTVLLWLPNIYSHRSISYSRYFRPRARVCFRGARSHVWPIVMRPRVLREALIVLINTI